MKVDRTFWLYLAAGIAIICAIVPGYLILWRAFIRWAVQ